MSAGHQIYTCLRFGLEAEAAASFYLSLFADGRMLHLTRCGLGGPLPEGVVLVAQIELKGMRLMLLNGGPAVVHSNAASLVVECDTQAEIDRLWSALTAEGGRELFCGWLADRFGVHWQVVPRQIARWMTSADPAATARVMAAVMTMVKLDMAALEAAFEGKLP